MTLEELEAERLANEEKLRYLEDAYFRKQEHAGAGYVMREKMGLKNTSVHSGTDRTHLQHSERKKHVQIHEGSPSPGKDLNDISEIQPKHRGQHDRKQSGGLSGRNSARNSTERVSFREETDRERKSSRRSRSRRR
jgi:hypothetical protein